MNRPVNFNDPTGHKPACDNGEWDGCQHIADSFKDDFDEFLSKATKIAKNKGKKDTLEAMARIVESAAEIFDGNWGEMMRALNLVFLGTTHTGPGTLQEAERFGNASNLPKDIYLGGYFLDAGFKKEYQDGANQIGHVWGFIANSTVLTGISYEKNGAITNSKMANIYHEFTHPFTGGSRQDFMLSLAGIEIGKQISNGTISPYELGDVLRTNLGTTP